MPSAPAEYQRPRPRRNDGSLSLALSLKLRGHEIRVKLLLHRMDRTYRLTRRYAWPPDSAATEFTIGTIAFNSTSCSFIIRSVSAAETGKGPCTLPASRRFFQSGQIMCELDRTGSKNLSHSCPGYCGKWSTVYAITELLKFLDHASCAHAYGPGAYLQTPLLVAHPLMENQPKQPAKSMGDGPDGLLVSQARQQPAKGHSEYASFDLDRGMSSLIQKPPHLAVAFGRTRALRFPCALFVPRTHPYP